MQDIYALYDYIKSNYKNYQKIKYIENEVVIVFYDEFEMKIQLKNYFNIYFNNIFYYNVDSQDIKDTVDDIFLNQNIFCLKRNKIKIVNANMYKSVNTFDHVWTISQKLK